MPFFSNVAEGIANFFINKDQSGYVNQQVQILNQQAEENQKRLKLVLIVFLSGITVLVLLMLFQRK